jgi:hypothetical protein
VIILCAVVRFFKRTNIAVSKVFRHAGMLFCESHFVRILQGGKNEIVPLYDRVLVFRTENTDKTAGGIIIPDTAKEKPRREGYCRGTGQAG